MSASPDPIARSALLTTANATLAGRWTVFDCERDDMAPAPDWFLDPRTGTRAPAKRSSWAIASAQPSQARCDRYLWELSRHRHVTLLAAAYALSGDELYALGVERQLRSWWTENRFGRGPHWTSCMELGLRLIAWVWSRRLLSDWRSVTLLFDENALFRTRLYQHQYLLAHLPSRGSSANNHRFAEAAGQFVACCALPYFRETPGWREAAAGVLCREIELQTFASGHHRELASDYHILMLELAIAAGVEGEATGHPLGRGFWKATCAMMDAFAATVDMRLQPPRQGDGDGAWALQLDASSTDRFASLLHTGECLFGAQSWWPKRATGDVRTPLWAGMAKPPPRPSGRPSRRTDHFRDAGITILRDAPDGMHELWCRCDAGPHGYLSIAAHAHADALSIEVRCDGVEILADPGTYTYHAEPAWRRYFCSTLAHNTLELGGCDQSVSGGPFLWTRHARSTIEGLNSSSDEVSSWAASHDGYQRLTQRATHRREVRLYWRRNALEIEDQVTCRAPLPARLAFHLGPRVDCELAGSVATLRWEDGDVTRCATLQLPGDLGWQAVRGRTDPPLGWYSPAFGVRVPAWCLLGEGRVGDGAKLRSELQLDPIEKPTPC